MLRRLSPTRVALPGPARKVRAGAQHSCALGPEERVLCWGENSLGQLGDGSTIGYPGAGALGGRWARSWIWPRAETSTCVLGRDGSLLCWGDDRWGQLGIGQRHLARATGPLAVLAAATSRERG